MDQQKTGGFIAARRKAIGLTQNQLAEQLGITGKAVSKWECGRSMPDLSLFSPLCALLGITLAELLAGEAIPAETLRERSDEILLDILSRWPGSTREAFPAEESAPPVLTLRHVRKVYGPDSAPTAAVKDVSFAVHKGRFVGIMGASGSGKTTLLNLIATIDRPSGGQIELDGQDLAALPESALAAFRREHLGFVFQEYNLLDTLTVYENIALALTVRRVPKERVRETVLALARRLEIEAVLDKFPYEISGGQQQRCACVRAVATRPSLILADEPTGALDSHAARQLLELFVLLCREYGATILMVTHDAFSASCCDEIFFMRDGEIRGTLARGAQSKQAFFAEILDAAARLTGGGPDVS